MAYPLDGQDVRLSNVLSTQPYPPYPFRGSWLANLVPVGFHDWSLQVAVPVTFALLYYAIAHGANGLQSGHDHTKGDTFKARTLRVIVVAHNALLCLYSLFTFLATAPVVVDLLVQGYRAAGHDGVKLALCSVPTETALLGRWVYIFYLSKYYEVVDSVILFLKGKKIGNLQSYHHAGALFSMWIAYRFQSQPVWVFVVFNSGVHTLMYAYYFSAALKLPFPRTLKRNLTTLQILQIASGTLIVNTYYLHRLDPARVYAGVLANGVRSALPAWLFAGKSIGADPSLFAKGETAVRRALFGSVSTLDRRTSLGEEALLQLGTFAQQRMGYASAEGRASCIETTGSALAIAGNTAYMAPLLVLFANFYVASYLKQQQSSSSRRSAAFAANGKNGMVNGNGKHTH